jgi:hypothetical protein
MKRGENIHKLTNIGTSLTGFNEEYTLTINGVTIFSNKDAGQQIPYTHD